MTTAVTPTVAVAKTNYTHSEMKKSNAINAQIKSEPKLANEPQNEQRDREKNGWNVTNFGIRS